MKILKSYAKTILTHSGACPIKKKPYDKKSQSVVMLNNLTPCNLESRRALAMVHNVMLLYAVLMA